MSNANAIAKLGEVSGTALTTPRGKIVGVRVTFTGDIKASELKLQLNAANPLLKGKELTRKIDDVLRGKETVAWAKHDAAVSALRSGGYIPDYMDARSKGATARYIKPTGDAVPTKEAAIKALGLTDAQVAALAKLQTLTPEQLAAF
jgi:hypothetical protein